MTMRLFTAALVALVSVSPLGAQSVTLTGGTLPGGASAPTFTFNTANAVRTVARSGTANLITGSGMATFHANNVSGVGLPAAGLRATSLRCVLDGPLSSACTSTSESARFIELDGRQNQRGVVSVGWGNDASGNRLGVFNGTGFDLFALEWANNEGYQARFQTIDGTWTDWGYNPGQVGYAVGGTSPHFHAWLTRFDFSDFGVGLGAFVVGAEFRNVLASDGFTNPQTGDVFTNGPVAPYYTTSDVTPDMFYVAAINDITTVPEPTSLALVALGGLLVGGARVARRKIG